MLGFLVIDFPVGFLTFRLGSYLLFSPPVEFPFRVSSACSYSGPRSGFSLHPSVFPSFVTRSYLSSFATGSSLRAESSVGVFVHSFPWFHFLSTSLGVLSRLLRFLSLLFSVCRLLSASEGFPCSFYTSLSCRLAFPSTLGLFLFLFLRLSLSSSGFPSSFFSHCYFCSLSILLLFTFLFYLI